MSDEKFDELLEKGPRLSMTKEWREIDLALRGDGLPGVTAKIEIGDCDLYVKTAWHNGRIVRIDINLSKGKDVSDDLPKSMHTVDLETTRFDLARSWVENECRMASNLLQTGQAGIGTIIEEWAGVEGYPSGYCPQLPVVNEHGVAEGATFQPGPLHAAAMLIRRRLVDWSESMEVVS